MTLEAAAPTLKTDCLLCPVRSCLVHRDGGEQARGWSEMLAPRQALMPGDGALQRAGDRLDALYSVRGGCVKTCTVDAAGNERIRGFYFPGDIIGLDALGGELVRRFFVSSLCSSRLAALADDVVADFLTFIEAAQSCALNCADVHEHIFAAVAGLNETEALLGVKPLHGSRRHGIPFHYNRNALPPHLQAWLEEKVRVHWRRVTPRRCSTTRSACNGCANA